MNPIKRNFIRFVCGILSFTFIGLFGCTFKSKEQVEAERAEEKQWKQPDDLAVHRVKKQDAVGDVFLLLDVSCSSNNAQRQKAGNEIAAIVDRAASGQRACVVPISEDSRATEAWCSRAIAPVECVSDPINPGPYKSQRLETKYKAATARVNAELEECRRQATSAELESRALRIRQAKEFIARLPAAPNTDIAGALYHVTELRKQSAEPFDLWVYSDMVEDPMRSRVGNLGINISGGVVHVRQLLARGAGYLDNGTLKWTTQFKSWGATSVDWKDFQYGEFSDAPAVSESRTEGRSVRPVVHARASPGKREPVVVPLPSRTITVDVKEKTEEERGDKTDEDGFGDPEPRELKVDWEKTPTF